MKIKIGNFNFINDKKEKINLSEFSHFYDIFDFFYLDGKEDILYIGSSFKFNNLTNPVYEQSCSFERNLAKRFIIVNYHEKINEQVNDFINAKAKQLFQNKDYSRYELYNNISIDTIRKVNRKVKFEALDSTIVDFEKAKIEVDEIIFDLYSGKVDNLEEMYNKGKFDVFIKAQIINFEIEKGQAPSFLNTILEIEDFLKDKKTVGLKFKNKERLEKVNSYLGYFMKKYNNKIEMCKDEELENLVSIHYGKKFLEIDINSLQNLENQIIITAEDKLCFKIDRMKKELQENFYNFKIQDQFNNNYDLPNSLEACERKLEEIRINNVEIVNGLRKGEIEEFPTWYNEDYMRIKKLKSDIQILEQTKKIEDIKMIAYSSKDEELQEIYEELKLEKLKNELEEENSL